MQRNRACGSSRRTCLRRIGGVVGSIAITGCLSSDDGPTNLNPDGNGTQEQDAGDGNTSSDTVHAGYETTAVRVVNQQGDELGAVTAAIADTSSLRYTGLSDTDSLPTDRGMLFVYNQVGNHTFVMRRMDFGIDIVYADDEGAITKIHHAPEPGPNEDGNEQHYPGRGQYVLEVNYNWTTERSITTGDVLEFDL